MSYSFIKYTPYDDKNSHIRGILTVKYFDQVQNYKVVKTKNDKTISFPLDMGKKKPDGTTEYIRAVEFDNSPASKEFLDFLRNCLSKYATQNEFPF